MPWPERTGLVRRIRSARGRDRDREPDVLWALDLETTGLEVETDHIIEVGLVPVVGRRVLVGQAWSSLVRPVDYRSAGTVAHGIMPGDLAGADDPAAVARELRRRMGNGPLLVHHAPVDLGFLRALHRRLGQPWADPPVVDTVELLTRRNRRLRQLGEPELPLQLGEARAALGLPPAAQHRAVDDAIATAELWLALTALPR